MGLHQRHPVSEIGRWQRKRYQELSVQRGVQSVQVQVFLHQ
jgi:hypothetical protein